MSFLKVIEQDLAKLAATFAALPADFKAALPIIASAASQAAPLVETGLTLSGNAPAAAVTQAVVTALNASVTSTPSSTKEALPSVLQTAATLANAVGASALSDHIATVATAVATASPTVSTSIVQQAVIPSAEQSVN